MCERFLSVLVTGCRSASTIKETPSKLCYVYQCVGCDSFHLQPVGRIASRQGSVRYLPGTGPVISPDCKQCGKHHNMGGPMWSAPIHNSEWIASMLSSVSSMKMRYPAFGKVHSILTAVSEVGFIRMQISGEEMWISCFLAVLLLAIPDWMTSSCKLNAIVNHITQYCRHL